MIPALGRWRQEDCSLGTNLSYIARLCLKNKKQKVKKPEAAAAGVGQLLSEPPSHSSVLGDQLWDSFGRISTH